MRHAVIATAALLNGQLGRGGFRYTPVMVTMTYRPGATPEPLHVSKFLKVVREHLRRRGLELYCVWVAELQSFRQDGGALHYHVIMYLPPKFKLPKPDTVGWWPHGSTRIERARCGVGYLAKYASKIRSKGLAVGHLREFAFPRGFRMHGAGGLCEEKREMRNYIRLPGWLRGAVQIAHKMRPAQGGGWISLVTGDIWPSMWKVERMRPGAFGTTVVLAPRFPGLEINQCTW